MTKKSARADAGRSIKRVAVKKRTRVSLDTKAKPRQDRSQTTYDAILEAAGKLLEEVGIERLSTNLVCKRAGLTPPALYRYFPNKYALLKELGAQLMRVQDEAVYAWQDKVRGAGADSVEVEAEKKRLVLNELNELTRKFPGGGWVMRALRAIPMLSKVRIESRESVAQRDYEALIVRFPDVDKRTLRIAATLCVEVLYASMELVKDEPDLDAEIITQEISYMTALYLDSFAKPRKKISLVK